MAEVVFVDTSVLLNVLDVPGKNSDRSTVMTDFKALLVGNATLVIPVAAVVEVGNHIAQLPSGSDRRTRASRFCDFLDRSLRGEAPWVVSGVPWDGSFLSRLINGDGGLPALTELCVSQVGSGDASILLELSSYRERADIPSAMPVRLWTLDAGLAAYA
jgi:hypothetical protein